MIKSVDKDKFFRSIYDHTFSIMLRIAVKVVLDQDAAEELCHDAYIKLYERIDLFPDADQAKYWLIRVVKNSALNYAKRKQRERRAYERVLSESRKHTESADTAMLRKESEVAVQEALQKLPEGMRMILVMKEYSELSYKDIAGALGITEANVKVRMFRARQKLGQILEESHGA